MKLIDVNSYVPQIERSPHKIYVVEFTRDELQVFKSAPKEVLKIMEPFSDIDEKTNINVSGIDGDKGKLGHSNVKSTHGIIMDFRPLVINITFWDKPTSAETMKSLAMPTELVKVTKKGDE